MPAPYRRRYGVNWRPWILGAPERPPRRAMWQNDGGEDAPLTPRGRWLYHWIIGGIVAIGVTLILVLR